MSALISVIIPAFRAQATIARAVQSALAQTHTDLEVIVVSDDGLDYRAFLLDAPVADDGRLRCVSTGRIGAGCHQARNVGLDAAGGGFIAALDADDVFSPERLARLLPIARRDGAVTDNPRVVSDVTGQELYRAFADAAPSKLGVIDLLNLSVPLFPLIAREHAQPRLPGIELGEDFVANLRLIDRIGALPAIAESLSEYRVVTGSLCHNDKSADRFERSYNELIDRLKGGDQLRLSSHNAGLALDALVRKRDFNRAFAMARQRHPDLDFQSFAAQQR